MPVPNLELPPGRYLSTALGFSPEAGGQTRAMFMRNRIFARQGGVHPTMLTLGAVPDLDQRRQALLDNGMLIEQLPLLNIYEHYRDRAWKDPTPAGTAPEDLGRFKTREETHSDGTPWRITYELPAARHRRVHDYLRPDGSPFLRIPSFSHADRRSWPDRILKIAPHGEVVGQFDAVGAWYREWIREFADSDQNTFVFIDTRRLVPHIVPMGHPRVHLVYLMHNIHVQEPRHWNSKVTPAYREVIARIDGLDAMVTLTHRQQEDLAMRRGATTNLFVVPNPVDLPDMPARQAARDPHRVTIVARLAAQKRLHHAIRVFERVRTEVPEAHLDIYGDGPERARLEREVAERGLGESITLHGHHPRAREALWTSSAFLMTSSFEGYPLSTLESMSHGCPVVCYDIKYGPREQISDDVDGFLVPAGDVKGAAARVVQLLQSPELVLRLGRAARQKAERHGTEAFLRDWGEVLRRAVELKPYRARVRTIEFSLSRLGPPRPRGLRRWLPRTRSAARRADATGTVELAGVLAVHGESERSTLDSAEVTLFAVHPKSAEVTHLPLAVERRDSAFHVTSTFDSRDLRRPPRDGRPVLRLRLVWQNRAWNTTLELPRGMG